MPTIPYQAENFGAVYGPNLAGTHTLTVSWPQIVCAALSVGKAQGDLALHGEFSLFEMAYRVAIVFANLREAESGEIVRSSAYDGLDPSEKGSISYFLGLTMAKLFAHQLMDVPWLMHLDVYRAVLNLQLLGNSKPDLVGLNGNNEWVVVEAKGRTNDFSETTLAAAKTQTQQVTTIGGVQPVLRVGTLTYFADSLTVAMRDPKGHSKRSRMPDIPLAKERLREDYYRPLSAWTFERPGPPETIVRRRPFRIRQVSDFDLSVGVPLFRKADTVNPVEAETLEGEFVGKDGVLVRLGTLWSEANMRLEPQVRQR